MKPTETHVCVVGSGAGAAPIALRLAEAGYHVVVLEKGPHLTEADFHKDEIGNCRRPRFVPDRKQEPHMVELHQGSKWQAYPTHQTGWDFWNGVMVGGATNLMSGYFHRLKPVDFALRSTFGPVKGANVVDWPIRYQDLEPYYTVVEKRVGVSGRVVSHPFADQRSTPEFPYPSMVENPVAGWVDDAAAARGLHSFPVARAVLAAPAMGRGGCSQTGYCAQYGCATGAKGSARAALLNAAVATGRCTLIANANVQRIHSDARGRISRVAYLDAAGKTVEVKARIYVVACQAIETARLLLRSTGPKHPHGLGNRSRQVGRNLLFSTAAWGMGTFRYDALNAVRAAQLRHPAPFLNRAIQDAYTYADNGKTHKGGTVEFQLRHPNMIGRAMGVARNGDKPLLWGQPLKDALEHAFLDARQVVFEAFADWMPTDDSRVTLDGNTTDRFGQPVARVRIGHHARNKEVADHLAALGKGMLVQMGATDLVVSSRGAPATNLVAGTCRFGTDPKRSVLDPECRAHDVENLFVTDGSFMPTGGSVPYTFTIYANAFRVADAIVRQLA